MVLSVSCVPYRAGMPSDARSVALLAGHHAIGGKVGSGDEAEVVAVLCQQIEKMGIVQLKCLVLCIHAHDHLLDLLVQDIVCNLTSRMAGFWRIV
jgi:hypothetical protein